MKFLITMSVLLFGLNALPALAAPWKVYVSDMNVVNLKNRDEMKTTMQMLLASRISNDRIIVVGSAAEADAIISGTYVVIGRIFSVDALAKSADGKNLTRAFVQGESQDELIPAIGKLAEKLVLELSRIEPPLKAASFVPSPVPPAISAEIETAPASGEIIRSREAIRKSQSWRSQPISGTMNLLAAGAFAPDGSRDLFLADNRRLIYYRQGNGLRQIAEREMKVYEKIISIDTIDSGTGTTELYLTVVRNEKPFSQIWQAKGGSLKLVAEGIPYFFRTMILPGSGKKLYAQRGGSNSVFDGEVFEAEHKGSEIKLKQPLKLPNTASIYTFNQFVSPFDKGKLYTIIFSTDNSLIVYDNQQKEIWRSIEIYGGSELFVDKQGLANSAEPGLSQIFMTQRIQVLSDGRVLVGKNDPLPFLGKSSYHRNGSVFCFVWNGDSLAEKWHTRTTSYYMPDYYYDEAQKELLQLEVTARPKAWYSGSTTLVIKKVE